ncbi:MAG: hypothetical protein RIQ93_238 [Verrucomicrobiota bacterium]|jgi:hypothetical protein
MAALHNSRLVRRVRSWPRRVVITLGAVLLVLLAARIALPYMVKRQVNTRLAGVPGYTGHVNDVGLSLWRGAYRLQGIAIYRATGALREPFFTARDVDFSLAWRELFHRKLVGDIVIDRPEMVFVKGPTEETSQRDADRRWQKVLRNLFPINITYFELRDGAIRYVDTTKKPHIDVFVKNMRLVGTGLRNRPGDGTEEFPARIALTGETLGGGQVEVELMAEPLAPQPHFHASFKVDDVALPALNDSLKAIAKVDVGRGTFRMAGEMAGRDGGFQGYVKPFFEDLEFSNIEDKEKGVFNRLWEHVVSGLAWLVKNKSRDQVATRVPFEGRFGDPKVGMLATVGNLFRHGFIQAFNPTVEGTVRADNVLPDGRSADGRDVSAVRSESDGTGAGAPTGRSAPPKRR